MSYQKPSYSAVSSVEEGKGTPTEIEEKNEIFATRKRYGLVAIAVFGCSFLLLPQYSGKGAPLGTVKGANLELPDYLVPLEKTDPEWDEYSSLLTSKYVVGDPGKGNMVKGKVELVRFQQSHFVFRTYGGDNKASQCGYWWVLNPPKDDKATYFEHFAICNEWNDASDIVRCNVPEGYITVVGIGQTVDCPDSGVHLAPDPSNLQLNGDICTAAIKKQGHLSCEYCISNKFNLELSACSNNGPSYIDGFSFNN